MSGGTGVYGPHYSPSKKNVESSVVRQIAWRVHTVEEHSIKLRKSLRFVEVPYSPQLSVNLCNTRTTEIRVSVDSILGLKGHSSVAYSR